MKKEVVGDHNQRSGSAVGIGDQRAAIAEPKWEYVEPEYLSHDALGYEVLLSAGGIMATDDEGEPYWVIEGEIEPKLGKLIVRAVNSYADMLAALKLTDGFFASIKFNRDQHPTTAETKDKVRAAIARAEGQS